MHANCSCVRGAGPTYVQTRVRVHCLLGDRTKCTTAFRCPPFGVFTIIDCLGFRDGAEHLPGACALVDAAARNVWTGVITSDSLWEHKLEIHRPLKMKHFFENPLFVLISRGTVSVSYIIPVT